MFVAPVETSSSLSVLALSIIDVSPTHSHRITAVDRPGGGKPEVRTPSLWERFGRLFDGVLRQIPLPGAR